MRSRIAKEEKPPNQNKESDQRIVDQPKGAREEKKEPSASQNEEFKVDEEEIEKFNSKYPFGDFEETREKKGTRRRRSKDILVIEPRDNSVEKKIKVIDVKRREERREKERKEKEQNTPPLDSSSSLEEPIYACVNKAKTSLCQSFNLSKRNLEAAKETNITELTDTKEDIYENYATFEDPPDSQEDIYTDVYNSIQHSAQPGSLTKSQSFSRSLRNLSTNQTSILNPIVDCNKPVSNDLAQGSKLNEKSVETSILPKNAGLDVCLGDHVQPRHSELSDSKPEASGISKVQPVNIKSLDANTNPETVNIKSLDANTNPESFYSKSLDANTNPESVYSKSLDTNTNPESVNSKSLDANTNPESVNIKSKYCNNKIECIDNKQKLSNNNVDLADSKLELGYINFESVNTKLGAATDISQDEGTTKVKDISTEEGTTKVKAEATEEGTTRAEDTSTDKETTKVKEIANNKDISEKITNNKNRKNNNNNLDSVGLKENVDEKAHPYPQPYEVDDVISTFM